MLGISLSNFPSLCFEFCNRNVAYHLLFMFASFFFVVLMYCLLYFCNYLTFFAYTALYGSPYFLLYVIWCYFSCREFVGYKRTNQNCWFWPRSRNQFSATIHRVCLNPLVSVLSCTHLCISLSCLKCYTHVTITCLHDVN